MPRRVAGLRFTRLAGQSSCAWEVLACMMPHEVRACEARTGMEPAPRRAEMWLMWLMFRSNP